jgi:hypothetical protein
MGEVYVERYMKMTSLDGNQVPYMQRPPTKSAGERNSDDEGSRG